MYEDNSRIDREFWQHLISRRLQTVFK